MTLNEFRNLIESKPSEFYWYCKNKQSLNGEYKEMDVLDWLESFYLYVDDSLIDEVDEDNNLEDSIDL